MQHPSRSGKNRHHVTHYLRGKTPYCKEKTMEYTKLGKSNLTVSKVCLGTMHFGHRTTEEEAFAIMDKALDMGINFLAHG